jgi:hypothetical protein
MQPHSLYSYLCLHIIVSYSTSGPFLPPFPATSISHPEINWQEGALHTDKTIVETCFVDREVQPK